MKMWEASYDMLIKCVAHSHWLQVLSKPNVKVAPDECTMENPPDPGLDLSS